MKKTMTINGVDFEVLKPFKQGAEKIVYYSNRTLTDCYERPSQAKRSIYHWWEEWYYSLPIIDIDINATSFGVHSFNSMMFTLTFPITINGKQYHCYITPKHNYIQKLLF